MYKKLLPGSKSGRYVSLFASAFTSMLLCLPGASAQTAQTAASAVESIQLPANWRDIKDGVGGYPAGPMLEIALRRTHQDKLEMFKWRSEFIAMLSAQPGPLIEREWHSISGIPANTGAGTWTGMTWWENQQRWQDMGNILFTSPVAANWLKTIDMTLVFVKPLDSNFNLHTLAQSGGQVLELGLLVFPTTSENTTNQQTTGANQDGNTASADRYLDVLKRNGAEPYRFAVYPNPAGFNVPYTVAYNKNGPPATTGERWFVYMVSYDSAEARARLQAREDVQHAFDTLSKSMVKEHSDIQLMTRTTSQVCIHKATGTCSLDPEECRVGVMGSGDTLAASCGEAPQACITSYNVCSRLSPQTCTAVGGTHVATCPSLELK